MQVITKDEIRELAETGARPCVSIYMPEYRKGAAEGRQNPVRLKNLLREVERQMDERKLKDRDFLHAAHAMVDNPDSWLHPGDGLAVFCAPDVFRACHLPMEFEEMVFIGDHFHLSPLLEVSNQDGRFRVLAVSQNQVRLIDCTRQWTRTIGLPPTVPQSLAESMKYDDPENRAQHDRNNPSGKPMFHGHNNQEGDGKTALFEYFRNIDKGLHEILREDRLPVLFAGVDYLFPIFRQANTHANLLDDHLPGNPDALSADQIRDRAWPIMEPHFRKAQASAVDRFGELLAIGRASRTLKEIVAAAYGGRVDTLFLASGIHHWGAVADGGSRVRSHRDAQPGDADLLDVAAVQTFLHGGEVYSLEREKVPDQALAAALFRY